MTYGISKLLKTNYDLGIKYSDFTKYKNDSLFSLRSNLWSIFNLYNNGQIDTSDCYKMILACNTFSVPLFLSSMLLLRSSNNAISNFLIKSIESDIKKEEEEEKKKLPIREEIINRMNRRKKEFEDKRNERTELPQIKNLNWRTSWSILTISFFLYLIFWRKNSILKTKES